MDETWSLLGIEPTQDAHAIRKAYAAKLKQTRPDENPEGFQALVEARDHALQMAKRAEQAPKRRKPAKQIDEPGAEQQSLAETPTKQLTEDEAPAVEAEAAPARQADDLADTQVYNTVVLPHVETTPAEDFSALLQTAVSDGKAVDLRQRWANVFNVMERTSFAQFNVQMAQVVQLLTVALKRDVGEIPDLTIWEIDPAAMRKNPLGRYADVLRDFESRFHFLTEDRRLLAYLPEAKARGLIRAITLSAGRSDGTAAGVSSPTRIKPLPRGYVEVGFADDIAMQAYFQRAREIGKYPLSFSFPALAFSPIFALYHRLHAVAVLSIAAAIAYFVLLELETGDNESYFHLSMLAAVAYLAIALSLAISWRQMKVEALRRRVLSLARKGQSQAEIETNLRTWGSPNFSWRYAPGLLIVALKSLAFFSNYFHTLGSRH